eukprot:m.287042 g.287042  ORF g.287042 m.287042 type:complete len:660 (+) comp15787_c0_seq1:3243-5222(+)
MKAAVTLLALVATAVCFQGAASSPPSALWWQTGVVYQVYPRSFLDACEPKCTGTGSIRGIASKLSYLKNDLGVDAIWISPIYDSPMADFGYDISNYTAIWPTFGTMQDFDNLMAAAKQIGMRVLMDFVPNHSSDQHPWFLESKSSLNNTKRDWYVWKNGTIDKDGTKLPPNNWRTMFCKDANCYGWTYDNTTDQWYYHCFLSEQPDLNWRNPDVVEAMHNVLRFWLDKGVDGFRVDAFPNILEDPDFRDEPLDKDWHGDPVADGYGKLLHIYTENVDGLHDIVRGMRRVLQEYGEDKVLIGEIYADKVVTEEDVISYYGTQDAPEFSMPFNMELIGFFDYTGTFDPTVANDPRDAVKLRALVDEYMNGLPEWAQPNFVLGNHDVHRIASRLGDDALTRVANMLLLTLRGTPTIYNGDEIGQLNGYVPQSQSQDPNCIANYTGLRCRDPERTPLQWNTLNTNANFSGDDVETWLPVSSNYMTTNVEHQMNDPISMFAQFKALLALRSAHSELNNGTYTTLDVIVSDTDAPAVFAFARGDVHTSTSHAIFVVLANLAKAPATVDATRPLNHVRVLNATLVFDTRDPSRPASPIDLSNVRLNATQAVLVHVFVSRDMALSVIVGASVAGLVVLFGAIFAAIWRRRRREQRDRYYRLNIEVPQ